MTRTLLSFIAAFGLVPLIYGCAGNGSTVKSVKNLDSNQVLLTTPDIRVVTKIPVMGIRKDGAIEPKYVTCAEPSPDVAKVFADSFNLGGALGGKGAPPGTPGSMSVELAAAVASAHAESVAQLGERLATIQLLRDGMYRACEAYANGAITPTAYAVLLSRYDDTMVTLLGSELAAGAFGRTSAGLTAEASGKASSLNELKEKFKEHEEALSDLDDAIEDLNKAEGEPVASVGTDAGDAKERAKERVQDAERELERKLNASAESLAKAGVTVGGGITPGQQTPAVAETIHSFQKTYLYDLSFDALDVACIIALDRTADDSQLTQLGRACRDQNLLGVSAAAKGARLRDLTAARTHNEATTQRTKLSAETVKWVQTSLKRIEGAQLSVDGVLSPQTRDNIRMFQAKHNLVVDGIPGPQTRAKLRELLLPNP